MANYPTLLTGQLATPQILIFGTPHHTLQTYSDSYNLPKRQSAPSSILICMQNFLYFHIDTKITRFLRIQKFTFTSIFAYLSVCYSQNFDQVEIHINYGSMHFIWLVLIYKITRINPSSTRSKKIDTGRLAPPGQLAPRSPIFSFYLTMMHIKTDIGPIIQSKRSAMQ